MFGNELLMVLMFLNRKDILYIVVTATYFSAATFLVVYGKIYGQSVQAVRLAFVMIRCTIYTEYLNRPRTDLGSIFTFEKRKQLSDMNYVQFCI